MFLSRSTMGSNTFQRLKIRKFTRSVISVTLTIKTDDSAGETCFVGEVIRVASYDEYSCCVSSNCRVKVNPVNSTIGQCNKCGMKQNMQNVRQTVLLELLLKMTNVKRRVSVFDSIIKVITSG